MTNNRRSRLLKEIRFSQFLIAICHFVLLKISPLGARHVTVLKTIDALFLSCMWTLSHDNLNVKVKLSVIV